jgi:uncharacterized membrane protein YhaH (DUF805 family)
MASETFEQVLTAAQADGSFTPAWKKFVNTKFFVPVVRPPGGDAKNFKLRMSDIMGDGQQSILISEVRERVEEQHGSSLASLSGADVVRMIHAEASILVALSDRAFNIAKDRVDWLKKGIEASQARAAEKARQSMAAASALAPAAASATAPAAAAFAATPAAVTLEKKAPAPPRRHSGPLDVAALKPRNVTIARIGLDFFVPEAWRETSLPTGFRYHDESSGSIIEATGFHRPNVSLAQWLGMRLGLVEHEMRFLKQDGATYDIEGEGWRDRVKGNATEFTGTFPGEDAESRYLVACIRVDGTLVSVSIRAPSDVFEENRALYKWFLSRIDINEAAAEVYRAPVSSSGPADSTDFGDVPGVLGFSLSGRIGRLRAMAYTFPVMLPIVLLAIGTAIAAPQNYFFIGTIMGIGLLFTLYFSLRLMVLRMHDVNLSGKWLLGFIVAIALGAATRNVFFVAVATVIFYLACMVVYLFVPGTDGDNNYGEPPPPNTLWVKIGAGAFIFLQLLGLLGGGKVNESYKGNLQRQAAQAEPVQIKDVFEPVAFTTTDGRMSVDFPAAPKEIEIPAIVRQNLGAGGSLRQYRAIAGGRVYMVTDTDYGKAPDDVHKAMQRLQESIVGSDGELAEEQVDMSFGGHPGREVKVRMANGATRSVRFAVVGSKVYMAMVTARGDTLSQLAANQFLESFAITQ